MPSQETNTPIITPQRTEQVDFSGGLSAVIAPHAIQPSEVQTSTNVDYGIEWSGASCRRGNIVYAWTTNTGTSSENIVMIARNYGLSTGTWNDSAIPWYAASDDGITYTGSGAAQVSLASMSGYSGGNQQKVIAGHSQYQRYAYIANGTSAFKTDGTNTYDWLMPQADTPTVSFAQQGTFTGTGNQAGAFVAFAGTWTTTLGSVIGAGTVTGTSTSSYFGNVGGVIVSTVTSGTGTQIIIMGSCATTNWENSVVFVTPPTGNAVTTGAGTYTIGGGVDFHQGYPNGDTTGTYTGTATVTHTMSIGQYGTDYILLGLPSQQAVVTIQRDLSIGDATFTNYWHAETTPANITDATTDPLSLLLAAQGTAVFQNQTTALNVSRAIAPNVGRNLLHATIPTQRRTIGKTAIQGLTAISPWATARSDYQFIGTIPNPTFTNIQAIRITIEFNQPNQQIALGGVVTYGAEGWCLNDQVTGIQYYQTFARVENGFIVAEGAPSVPSAPQKAQYAYGQLVCAANTNTTAGITHRVFYRTGGLLQDAYRVGSCTITSGTSTIYDYNLPDLLIVGNPSLKRNLWSIWPSTSAGTGLPGVNAVSEAWQERIWIGVQNQLYWSAPGQPAQIQDDVQTTVADNGDVIQAIIPSNNLIIVNQNSVYEMSGSIFEGTNADWTLQRTGARRGCAAPRTAIKTPYGIVLFSFDGMSLYRPGYGLDQELDWAYLKMGDLWKGTGAADPAPVKGRIPALNQTAIFNSCAAYRDEKIYLAVPTGVNTYADTVFVLDMEHQKVWMYQYPFKITSMFTDRVLNRIMVGTDHGTIQQLETGLTDALVTNSTQGVAWFCRTKDWSTPTDVIVENLQFEQTGTTTAYAIIDHTNTVTLTTAANTTQGWVPAAVGGTIGDSVSFSLRGTQSAISAQIDQMNWDFIPQAPKVTFFQTDVITVPSENYVKTWLFEADTLGTATITATMLINGTPVTLANGGTSTSIVYGTAGKRWFELSPANITTAKQVQVICNATQKFKYYDNTWEFEPKPFEKTTWLVTYKKLGGFTQVDMARFYAMDIEGTLTATVTNTWIIDGVAFQTNTFTISSPNAGEQSGVGRMYADQIPFMPGARGYLFQQQMTSGQPFRVWKAHMDIDRIGVKGLSRVTLAGTPSSGGS